jgi:hypothetical protein
MEIQEASQLNSVPYQLNVEDHHPVHEEDKQEEIFVAEIEYTELEPPHQFDHPS